jgi:hypothetical protein
VTTRLLIVVALLAVVGAAGDQRRLKMFVSDLQLSHGPNMLPIAFESLYAATLGDQLHIVGLDEAHRARHLAIDGRGEFMVAAAELPLIEVTGLAACDGALVVSGATAGDRPKVLRVKPAGQVAWRAEVPAGKPLQYWPRPICAAGTTWLFSTTSGARTAMRLIEVSGERLSAPLTFALDDDTLNIDVLADAEGVLVARVHANGQRMELVRISDGRVRVRIDVEATRPTAPSLAHVGDRVALAWVAEPREPHLQWFDMQLKPLGASTVLPIPPLSGALASVRLMAAPDGALAIVFRSQEVVGDSRTVHHPDGTTARREPRRMSPLWVAAYNNKAHRLGPPHLIDADAKLYAGDWLGGAIVVGHRGRETHVSVFTRKPEELFE